MVNSLHFDLIKELAIQRVYSFFFIFIAVNLWFWMECAIPRHFLL